MPTEDINFECSIVSCGAQPELEHALANPEPEHAHVSA